VKKIKKQIPVIALVVTAATAFNVPASAGVFEQMAAAASSSYSREYMMNTKPELSDEQVARAIKEVIELGSDRVVENVIQEGRYDNRQRLSAGLRKAKRLATRHDYRDQFLQFEQQINEATVALAPAMNGLVKQAVTTVEIAEPRKLLAAQNTTATNYLYTRLQTTLQRRLQPVAKDVLRATGAADTSEAIGSMIQFDDLLSRLMVDYVVEQSMRGFFLELELQEQEIRQNPASRSTALLRDVFSAK